MGREIPHCIGQRQRKGNSGVVGEGQGEVKYQCVGDRGKMYQCVWGRGKMYQCVWGRGET